MQDGRNLARRTAVIHRGENLNTILQKIKKKPEIQIQMSKLDKISGVFWGNYKYQNHVARRTKLHVLKDDVPILVNYIDVQRRTKTSIDLIHEATVDDYWNIDGDKSLSEPWISVTRFELLNKNPPQGHLWVQGRLTKNQVTT